MITKGKNLNNTMTDALSADTQVLTPKGWIALNKLSRDDVVAQVDGKDNSITFTVPRLYAPTVEPAFEITGIDNTARQVVSKRHRIYFEYRGGNDAIWRRSSCEAHELLDIPDSTIRFITSGAIINHGDRLSDREKFMIVCNEGILASDDHQTTIHAINRQHANKIVNLAKANGYRAQINDCNVSIMMPPFHHIPYGSVIDLEDASFEWCHDFLLENMPYAVPEDRGARYQPHGEDVRFFETVAALCGYATTYDSRALTVSYDNHIIAGSALEINELDNVNMIRVQVPTAYLLTRNLGTSVVTGSGSKARPELLR